MTIQEKIARLLYEMWCVSADGAKGPGDTPDWETWDRDGDLNPVGLNKQRFMDEAKDYLNGTGIYDY